MELDWTMATKEFLAIEFKRTQDARIICVERATAVAQEQYKSLLCTVVVFFLLVGARRRSAVRCGAERSGATARPKVFEEQSELEALSVFNGMRKATPCNPLHPLRLVAFHH
jgi:hypothetical protein